MKLNEQISIPEMKKLEYEYVKEIQINTTNECDTFEEVHVANFESIGLVVRKGDEDAYVYYFYPSPARVIRILFDTTDEDDISYQDNESDNGTTDEEEIDPVLDGNESDLVTGTNEAIDPTPIVESNPIEKTKHWWEKR